MTLTVQFRFNNKKFDSILKKIGGMQLDISRAVKDGTDKASQKVIDKAKDVLRERVGTLSKYKWPPSVVDKRIIEGFEKGGSISNMEYRGYIINVSPHAGYREVGGIGVIERSVDKGPFPIGKYQGFSDDEIIYSYKFQLKPGYHFLETARDIVASPVMGPLSQFASIIGNDVLSMVRKQSRVTYK